MKQTIVFGYIVVINSMLDALIHNQSALNRLPVLAFSKEDVISYCVSTYKDKEEGSIMIMLDEKEFNTPVEAGAFMVEQIDDMCEECRMNLVDLTQPNRGIVETHFGVGHLHMN